MMGARSRPMQELGRDEKTRGSIDISRVLIVTLKVLLQLPQTFGGTVRQILGRLDGRTDRQTFRSV